MMKGDPSLLAVFYYVTINWCLVAGLLNGIEQNKNTSWRFVEGIQQSIIVLNVACIALKSCSWMHACLQTPNCSIISTMSHLLSTVCVVLQWVERPEMKTPLYQWGRGDTVRIELQIVSLCCFFLWHTWGQQLLLYNWLDWFIYNMIKSRVRVNKHVWRWPMHPRTGQQSLSHYAFTLCMQRPNLTPPDGGGI